tara:strand:- start:651 stop:788 length:138 start_codon:yes stop_codon:yes gene_type:complete
MFKMIAFFMGVCVLPEKSDCGLLMNLNWSQADLNKKFLGKNLELL